MNRGKIVVQIGSTQRIFQGGDSHPEKDFDLIENLVTCDKSRLSTQGGSGRIRLVDSVGNMVVQLSIIQGNCIMSDEGRSIVVLRGRDDSIKSYAYVGTESLVDFKSSEKKFLLDSVKNYISSLKSLYNSWKVQKGEISSIVIVKDKSIFDALLKDSFFNNFYVLLEE